MGNVNSENSLSHIEAVLYFFCHCALLSLCVTLSLFLLRLLARVRKLIKRSKLIVS